MPAWISRGVTTLAVIGFGVGLVGCAEPQVRMAQNDPYQECLYRGTQIGDLPYSATRFYQAHVEDRIWAPVKSPVAQCSELRAHGEL